MKFLLGIFIFGLVSFCTVNSSEQVGSRNSQDHPQTWTPNGRPIFEDKVVLTEEERDAQLFTHLPRGTAEPGPDYRLPANLIPESYVLQIRPIIDGDYPGIGKKDTAPGSVYIIALCVNPTRKIVMHSKFLQINETSIQVMASAVNLDVSSVEYDEARDFLIINLESELRNNTYVQIDMNFIANVPPNDSLRGLYSESYWDPLTNRTKVMAATQLEPLRARQVFPCFDEPTYKAIFLVSIGRTENFTSLSNAPYRSTIMDPANPGWHFDSFNFTVPMPTYLLALAVHDYGYNEAFQYRLPVKVYGPRHLTDKFEGRFHAQLTANGTALLMNTFEKKFGIAYNMPKVDSISVPYKRGAMENFGLVTYGQSYLMYFEGTTTTSELRNMYNILAHELAHQWFGNLVTCKWWSDIWLNEGFATYMSYVGQHEVWPEFSMLTHMLTSVNNALQYDAGPSSHPIHREAYDAAQIGSNMDTIGYDKGAGMVRLMESFLGDYVFYSGLTEYLTAHYDDVAEQNDLFRALNASARDAGLELPKNVTSIMNTWTLQKGFPLVRVSQTGAEEFTISQEPWENSDVRNDTSNPGTAWDIPVKYLIESGQDSGQSGSLWLLKEEQSKNVPVQNGNGWILANHDAGGYYRTLYDDQLSARITTQLLRNQSVFPAEGRVRLLDDQLNLGFQQYVPIQSALEFTKYLKNESDPTVWHAVLNNLLKVKNFYRNLGSSENEDLAALEASLGQSIATVLYSIPESIHLAPSSRSILRSQLLEWTCQLSFTWCDDYAGRLLSRWKESTGGSGISPDIQSTIYCKMVELDSLGGFEWLTEQYLKTNDPVQKTRMSTALGCSNNFTKISELTDMILHPTGDRRIEKEHSIAVFQKLMTHSQQGPFSLALIFYGQPQEIPNYYDRELSSVTQILSAVTPYYSRESHLEIIRMIQEVNPDFYKGSLDPVISAIEKNMEWLEVFRHNMTTWFKENPTEIPTNVPILKFKKLKLI